MAATLNKEKRIALELEAWDMRRKGKTMQTIAQKLKVSVSTVHDMLSRVSLRYHDQLADAVKEQKAEQSARLDYLIEEALDAWDRSQRDAEKKVTKTKELETITKGNEKRLNLRTGKFDPEDGGGLYLDDDGEEVPAEVRAQRIAENTAAHLDDEASADKAVVVERVTTEEAKGQVGDPRFLAEARAALEAQREIWGLDAPKKQEVSGPGGTPIQLALTEETQKKASEQLKAWQEDQRMQLANTLNAPQTAPTSPTTT